MDGGGRAIEPGGEAPEAGIGGNAAQSLTLAQEQAAGGKYATPYYALLTNSGDHNGAIPAVDGNQRVRLVDPNSGQVIVEGTGKTGAQQIATLANSVSQDLGRKAAWQVQYEFEPDQFTTVGTDRADPKSHLLQTLVRIAAPLVAAAIPGLGPALAGALGVGGSGAALAAGAGGLAGNLATGNSLTGSLLAGLTAGAGSSLGGALSGALRGAPISFAGVNPLGDIASKAGGALAGVTGGGAGASLTDLGLGALAPGYGGAAAEAGLTSALGAGLNNTIAPLTVTGAAPSALTGLAGGAGGALGSVLGGGGSEPDPTRANTGAGIKDFALDTAGQTLGGVGSDLGVYGLAQLTGVGPGNPDYGADTGVNPDGTATIPAPGYDGTPDVGPMPTSGALSTVYNSKVPFDPSLYAPRTTPNLFEPDGQRLNADGSIDVIPGARRDAPAALPGTAAVAPAAPAGGGGANIAAAPEAAAPAAPGGGANIGGSAGGGGAPAAAAPKLNVRGSMAPDIYPWRRQANVSEA